MFYQSSMEIPIGHWFTGQTTRVSKKIPLFNYQLDLPKMYSMSFQLVWNEFQIDEAMK